MRGDYLFTGKGYQLEKIWERLFIKSSGVVILQPEVIGRIPGNQWLFGDCVVWADGNVQELNQEKIAQKGLVGLSLPQGKKGLPKILTKEKLDIPGFINLLQKNLGEKALLGIGWLVATFLSSKIFRVERCFPILFLFGKRGSGKNVFGRWLTRLTGFDYEGKSFKSTAKGVERVLASYSDLPFWLNEFRNTARQDTIETLLNVYGRENYIRAEKSNDNKIVEKDIISTLILSGQETPKDNGVFSRCLILQFSEQDREDGYKEQIDKLNDLLPSFTLQILEKYNVLEKEFFQLYPKVKEEFTDETKNDPRLTINYSIPVTGIKTLAKLFEFSIPEDFMEFAVTHSRENKKVKEAETEVGEFWNYIEVLLEEISSNDYFMTENGKIYIWFSGLFAKFMESYRRKEGKTPFKESSIRDYLKEEDYFIEVGQQKKLLTINRKCLVLDETKFKEAGYEFFSRKDCFSENEVTNY